MMPSPATLAAARSSSERDAAGENDRNCHRARQLDGRIEVGAAHHAVAADVGEDDGGDAGILEALGKVERRRLRLLRPALDGDPAVAGVDADGDAAGEVGAGRAHQIGIAQRGGAEDHPARRRG